MTAPDLHELLRTGRRALAGGALDEALAAIVAAFDGAAATGERNLEAEALLEMSRCLQARGAKDQATLCIEQAVAAAAAADAPELEAEARALEAELLVGLGAGAQARARLEAAVKLLDEAAARARRSGALEKALAHLERGARARDRLVELAGRAGESVVPERVLAASANRRDDEERRRARILEEALHATSRRLVEERDPDRLVVAVLDGAVKATGAERGFVLLSPDEDEEEPPPGEARTASELPAGLAFAAARNFDRVDLRRPEFKVSHSVIEKTLASMEPLLVHDAGLDSELSETSSVRDHGLRAIVCVPFESPRGTSVRGVLYLDNRFGAGTFAAPALPALAAFAAHAALALENARLHARADRERRAGDLARARADDLAQRLERELARDGDAAAAPAAPAPAARDGTRSRRPGFGGIVGASNAMQELYAILERIADAPVPVLVRGESGTGKELVARAIHFESARRKEPFVSENCAAIPETLLESTLFGHEAGAFTGATARRSGIFELAGTGTLFLDEVGELTASCQAKLLRVLEERRARRVGGSVEFTVDARIIAATNRDLESMVKKGGFREDLYFRLNVVTVRVPPLRDRRDDIPLLFRELVARNLPRDKTSKAPPRLSAAALRALLAYSWPGNVRELENEVRRLLALKGDMLDVADLSADIVARGGPAPARAASDEAPCTLDEAERKGILAALRAAKGNKVRAAELLAIPRGSLWHKMKHHRIRDEEYA